MMYSNIDLQWFAAEDEGRTEEPSEYKLEKARKEGRVAKSQELNSALVMLLSVIVLTFLGPSMLRDFVESMKFYFTRCAHPDITDPAVAEAFFNFFFRLTLPVGIVAIVGGVAGNIIQNRGFLFSTKPIEMQFSKIVPKFGEYFKKTLFSFEGVFNIIKSIGKVAVIGAVAYALIRRDIPVMMLEIQNGNIGEAAGKIARMASEMLIISAIIFLVIAIPDYLVQRRQFMESMKMTKQEVKEEYKEMEGDPDVKNHLQQEQRRLLQQNMPKAVKESDVVITNPTHFAVALKYDSKVTDQAPQVTAKGEDETAMTMKRIARENSIPIVENRPLARGLYTDTKVGDIIPEQYIRAIALVYQHIHYNIDSKK
jgi:flagellar biosynthesis protein FlhB